MWSSTYITLLVLSSIFQSPDHPGRSFLEWFQAYCLVGEFSPLYVKYLYLAEILFVSHFVHSLFLSLNLDLLYICADQILMFWHLDGNKLLLLMAWIQEMIVFFNL